MTRGIGTRGSRAIGQGTKKKGAMGPVSKQSERPGDQGSGHVPKPTSSAKMKVKNTPTPADLPPFCHPNFDPQWIRLCPRTSP